MKELRINTDFGIVPKLESLILHIEERDGKALKGMKYERTFRAKYCNESKSFFIWYGEWVKLTLDKRVKIIVNMQKLREYYVI